MNEIQRSFACATCGCTRFYADLGLPPAQPLLLERIDEEGNCVLASATLRNVMQTPSSSITRLYCAHCDATVARPNPLQPA